MNIFAGMVRAHRRRRNLQALQQLDDRLLRDIGFDAFVCRGRGAGPEIGRLQDLGRR